MAKTNQAQTRPELLRWAADRAGSSASELAKAAGTSEVIVEHWLEGERQPSFRQAKKLAKHLRVPFGYLFLSTPPPDDLPIPDFRTIQNRAVSTISLDLRDVVLATLRKQAWLSEYLQEVGAEPREFVGRASPSQPVPDVARDIEATLGRSVVADRSSSPENFLRALIDASETIGINVLRSGIVANNTHRKLNVKEFRGFALSDAFAPFIFINSTDAKVAQIFTLLHELGHIWHGETGISGQIARLDTDTEKRCNQIAAEILVPAAKLASTWDEGMALEEQAPELAKTFRTSRYVIAIKAYELAYVEFGQLSGYLETLRGEQHRSSDSDSDSRGNFYNTTIAKNGRSFTREILSAVDNQQVLIRDAAALLELRPKTLYSLSERLTEAS